MKAKLIGENKTEVQFSNKKEGNLINQLKFFGAIPTKESSLYTYFKFNGDIQTTMENLGIRI
ncbi:TPA: hypothetical protein N2D99_002303 [Clostridium botulinum]|nr:hypothetical protein [Clostridium botulinum]